MLNFIPGQKHWTDEQWSTVLFMCDIPFSFINYSGYIHIWGEQGTRNHLPKASEDIGFKEADFSLENVSCLVVILTPTYSKHISSLVPAILRRISILDCIVLEDL